MVDEIMTNKLRIFNNLWADIYLMYVAKAQRKGQTASEVDEIITWLTEYSTDEIRNSKATIEEFFANTKINENAKIIKGKVCGVQVSEVADPTMQKIRWLPVSLQKPYN